MASTVFPLRSGYTLLPPGYMQTHGGKLQKAVTAGAGAGEATKGGAPGAALGAAGGGGSSTNVGSNSSSSRSMPGMASRWLLTDDQVSNDISFMRVRFACLHCFAVVM